MTVNPENYEYYIIMCYNGFLGLRHYLIKNYYFEPNLPNISDIMKTVLLYKVEFFQREKKTTTKSLNLP